MRRAWKVTLQDGAITMVRVVGKSLSSEECMEILEYRGYAREDIQNISEAWEDEKYA